MHLFPGMVSWKCLWILQGDDQQAGTYWTQHSQDQGERDLHLCNLFFFFLDFIDLFMRQRDRSRDIGRWRSRFHAGSPIQASIPGLQDHTLDRRWH